MIGSKKNILLACLTLLLYNNSFAQLAACANVDLGPDTTLSCTSSCITLEAEVTEVGVTNSYSVSSINYAPPYPFNQGTPILVGYDDVWSEIIPLPFTFCFFGNTYDKIVIGANGVITFDTTLASPPGFNWFTASQCDWPFSQSIPNSTGLPYRNTINGAYHDINPEFFGDITIDTLGSYPCRTFVVNYNEIPHFLCSSITTTQQIVLYETTNIIEVYIQDKPTCTNWNNGNAVIGIQNATGTLGYTPPARNTGPWATNNEAWRFSPDGSATYSIEWFDNAGTSLGNNDTLIVCPSATETYSVNVTYDICDGTQVIVTDDITVAEDTCIVPQCQPINNFSVLGTIEGCCYYVSNDTMSWTNANALCSISGGDMVAINSQLELDSLNILLGNVSTPPFGPNAHWLGLEDGTSYWNNGDSLTLTNYDGSYSLFSNGNYMYIQTNGLWDNSDNAGTQVPDGIYAVMEICPPSYGCTDSTALNYDPLADIDDGSCNYCNQDTSYTNITSCDSVLWNGNWYNTSGTYDTTFTISSSCDSTAILNLTITPPSTSTTNESACNSYSWNGTTYNASGTYTWTGVNANGCDSIATLNLVINTPNSSTSSLSSCDPITWNGQTYSSSGSYSFLTTNNDGCDSTANLNLTINPVTSSNTSLSSCIPVTWNGQNYSSSGNYSYLTTNSNGCDSTANLSLTINSTSSSTTTINSCVPITWNGQNYSSSGNYSFLTTNSNGCDSTANLNLVIGTVSTSSVSATECGSYNWNGQTYNSTGTYTYTSTNANGCDSIVTLNLIINSPTSSTSSLSSCDPVTWNGQTYTSSGSYSFLTTNNDGCDSIANLNLTINPVSSSNTSLSSCIPVTWNGQTYTSSGNYSYLTTNSNGCDSTANLSLTINSASSSTTTINSCVPITWNGQNYSSSGNYSYLTTNSNGCDSTANLNLVIGTVSTSSVSATECGSYNWNGQTYNSTGTYTYTSTNSSGCDSIVTLNLIINSNTSSTSSLSSCDPVTWNGQTYSSSGSYSFLTTNNDGCDSTANLNLTINPVSSSNTSLSSCIPITWNGQNYSSSGNYSYLTTNSNGCDSTANLSLTIGSSSVTANVSVDACNEYFWNGINYENSGVYSYTTTNNLGCDSTTFLTLNVFDDEIFIPNTFTPNKTDNINDRFYIHNNLNEFKMWIYNRWGEEIFYTEDGQLGWDGKYKNKICQDGLYVWMIEFVCGEKSKIETGHIHLLK